MDEVTEIVVVALIVADWLCIGMDEFTAGFAVVEAVAGEEVWCRMATKTTMTMTTAMPAIRPLDNFLVWTIHSQHVCLHPCI